MLTRVDHIDLRVPDLEQTVAFFKQLGLEEVRRSDNGRGSVEVALPGSDQVLFEIREDEKVEQVTVAHIAFGVDSTGPAIEQLKDNGISFDKEGFLVRDTGRTVSNFRDPSGARWQLSE